VSRKLFIRLRCFACSTFSSRRGSAGACCLCLCVRGPRECSVCSLRRLTAPRRARRFRCAPTIGPLLPERTEGRTEQGTHGPSRDRHHSSSGRAGRLEIKFPGALHAARSPLQPRRRRQTCRRCRGRRSSLSVSDASRPRSGPRAAHLLRLETQD